jgi:hypothetical protein
MKPTNSYKKLHLITWLTTLIIVFQISSFAGTNQKSPKKLLENNSWQKLSNYHPDTMDAGKVK